MDETLFRQLVGSLIYLIATRPDVSFTVSYISRFMSTPKADHWIAAKRVLRYVRGTLDYGLLYTRSSDPILVVTQILIGPVQLMTVNLQLGMC